MFLYSLRRPFSSIVYRSIDMKLTPNKCFSLLFIVIIFNFVVVVGVIDVSSRSILSISLKQKQIRKEISEMAFLFLLTNREK